MVHWQWALEAHTTPHSTQKFKLIFARLPMSPAQTRQVTCRLLVQVCGAFVVRRTGGHGPLQVTGMVISRNSVGLVTSLFFSNASLFLFIPSLVCRTLSTLRSFAHHLGSPGKDCQKLRYKKTIPEFFIFVRQYARKVSGYNVRSNLARSRTPPLLIANLLIFICIRLVCVF